jgi:hypothetical protein
MQEPDPNRGAFRWASHGSRRFLNTFTGGGILAAAVATAIGAAVQAPEGAHAAERIAYGLGGFLASLAIVLGLVYGTALLLAPFQQRKALRLENAAGKDRIRELETKPVSDRHLIQLHQIAGQLRHAVAEGGKPEYGMPPGIEENIWRTAFLEHFPGLADGLDKLEVAGQTDAMLADRLEREAQLAGMWDAPWTAGDFLPAITTMTSARAMTGMLGGPLADEWQEYSRFLQWSGPDNTGPVIARFIPGGEGTAKYKEAFREFVARAQDLPEARIIRPAWEAANYVRETVGRDLAVIEQTDVITTRCYLCRGGDGWVTGPIRPPAEEEAAAPAARWPAATRLGWPVSGGGVSRPAAGSRPACPLAP